MAAPAAGEAFDRASQLCERSSQSQQLLGPILASQYNFRLLRGALQRAAHHAEELSQLDKIETRTYGALCIMLVSLRIAEIREHAVAHVLGDKSAIALDEASAAAMIGADDPSKVLGVEPA
jgi:hypothetical protein